MSSISSSPLPPMISPNVVMPAVASGSCSISVMGGPLTVKFPTMKLYVIDVHEDFPFLTDKEYWIPPISLWFYEHRAVGDTIFPSLNDTGA